MEEQDKYGCTIDVGYEVTSGGQTKHVWLRPEDVREYVEGLRKQIRDFTVPVEHVENCKVEKMVCLGCLAAKDEEKFNQLLAMLDEEREPSPALLEAGKRYREQVVNICQICKDKPGKMRVYHGAEAGYHCDECWADMIDECRKRSW